jgi:hypothetical protein
MRETPRQRLYNPPSVAAIIHNVIDPRPVEYHGQWMRSTLEADFARHLDQLGASWTYEPAIFGAKGTGYLPDFRVTRDDGSSLYIEVKPTKAEVPLASARMEVIWKDESDAMLMVACAEGSEFYVAVIGQPWESFIELWKHG